MAATAPPIGVQLYSLRNSLTDDFDGVIRKVADIGYIGVEPYGGLPVSVEHAATLFKELGLQVPSMHCPLPLGDDQRKVLDMAAAYNCRRIISPWLAEERFATLDEIRRSCDLFNEANRVANDNGLSFGIHNHWQEFATIDGRVVYEVMLDYLEPTVFFEVDVYWVKTAGPDPVAVIKRLGSRAPILHIKDGPTGRNIPMTAVGDGTLDIPAIIAAGADDAEWLIVELDDYAGVMMEAIDKSYHYLIGKGLARGTKS